jgi:hypothetical protein
MGRLLATKNGTTNGNLLSHFFSQSGIAVNKSGHQDASLQMVCEWFEMQAQ